MKNIISKTLSVIFILTVCVIIVSSSDLPAHAGQEISGYYPESFWIKGRYFYYTHPQFGDIHRFDTKTKNDIIIRKNEGTTWGYGSFVVKGNYIYALLDTSEGSDGQVTGSSVYRISLDGKKIKCLVAKNWGDFVVSGKRIYYYEQKGGNNFDAQKGRFMSVGINGKGRKEVKDIEDISKIKSLNTNKGYRSTYPETEVTFKSGKYSYTVSKDGQTLKQGKKTIFKLDGPSWSHDIFRVYANGKHLLVAYTFMDGNNYVKAKIEYMDKDGKNRKVLSEYFPAG